MIGLALQTIGVPEDELLLEDELELLPDDELELLDDELELLLDDELLDDELLDDDELLLAPRSPGSPPQALKPSSAAATTTGRARPHVRLLDGTKNVSPIMPPILIVRFIAADGTLCRG